MAERKESEIPSAQDQIRALYEQAETLSAKAF